MRLFLNDGKGQGNNIAVFPTFEQGICAQMDLWRTSKNYRNKRFADAIGEMEPILSKHHHEIALDHAAVPLEIAHDRYLSMCEAGALRIVTARDDGVMVGPAVDSVTDDDGVAMPVSWLMPLVRLLRPPMTVSARVNVIVTNLRQSMKM